MNILFFIGNGFDINLGMKTRYSDFYEHYNQTESSSTLVNKLKKAISKGIVNWADLEIAFGNYTVNLEDIEDFDEVYEDIVNKLGDYLKLVEEDYNFERVDKSIFFKYLCEPETSLAAEDSEEIKNYKNQWKNSQWSVNIITLNYTTTIERIIGDTTLPFQIGPHDSNQTLLRDIFHIHGYTDKRTVLGVNDISQIAKEEFHSNIEVLEALIKTKCNRVQKHNVDRHCEKKIDTAHLICIFGSSLGDTDNYWWQLIGQQLRRDIKIIIFSKGEEVNQRFGQKVARTRRAIKKVFFSKTDLTDDEKKMFEGNVYVGVNTNMFNLLK